MIIKGRNIIEVLFCFTIISIYIVNDMVRMLFFNIINLQGNITQVNLLYMIFVSTLLLIFLFNGNINKITFYIAMVTSVLVLINYRLNSLGNFYVILVFIFLLLPLLTTTIRLGERIKYIFTIFLNIFNFIIGILFITGVADFFSKGSVQLFISRFWNISAQGLVIIEHSSGVYRFYSIFGHPLVNAKYFLIFLCMNNIYNKIYGQKINTYIIIIITLIGLLLCGSKSAFILGLIYIIFMVKMNNKVIYYLCVFALISIFLNTSLFRDNLFNRFIMGIESNNLSTGRYALLQSLINSNLVEKPKILFGNGYGYSFIVSNSLSRDITNFEYPLVMFLYDNGVIITILIYSIILIYPVITLIKRKNYYLLINYLILFIYMNGYQSLATFSEGMAMLCFELMIILNLGDQLENK